jgi:hypothetical protein
LREQGSRIISEITKNYEETNRKDILPPAIMSLISLGWMGKIFPPPDLIGLVSMDSKTNFGV